MHSPRAILANELEKRKAGNSNYSLRAFARDSGVSPAFMSEVINGVHEVSLEKAAIISKSLKWSRSKRDLFAGLISADKARSGAYRDEILGDVERLERCNAERREITKSELAKTDSWFFDAILELTLVNDFVSDGEWIASKLGISKADASQAIGVLLGLGLLAIEKGKLVKACPDTVVPDHDSQTLRKLHRAILNMAEAALERPLAERDFRGMTFAIDTTKIEGARLLIRDFVRELSAYLESGNRDAVYHFSSQLFSLENQ